ncbi:phosphate ABC transporter permease subunit PstC [Rehaibacterium terrae]|jgi:phosphate transport system permease protein|uniref:Phosphate transport system permease protein n=1 Tax=Rehaibacterium terrae TaxID=1341696 RepID=A0A7W8DDS0_9GAMM|nr:phosphate ABC transporter permease subunit PstC [Rehaibacterium terrae]MBB5015287.1 phosphate transport system permease protein [Rehaibacterium terrae]
MSNQTSSQVAAPARRFVPSPWRKLRERAIEALLFLAAFSAVAITAAIVIILVYESAAFFEHVPLWTFLTDTQWTPLFENARYGILPLVAGTLTTSLIALLVAVPLGTITAIYLSEFARPRVREVVKPILELISGVPTVVFGYFALLFVTPLLQKFIPGLPGFNMLGPGIVIGIMIIPYISSLSEDAMRAVPMHLREASYGMGASRFQTAVRVVTPAALSGIVASYILGISRAVGETMVVAIAAGQQPNLTFNPTEAAATITAFIVQVAMGDLPHGSIGYQSIFAAGLTLFVITLVFNLIGHWIRKRWREAY